MSNKIHSACARLETGVTSSDFRLDLWLPLAKKGEKCTLPGHALRELAASLARYLTKLRFKNVYTIDLH